jgi:hypothetical protein
MGKEENVESKISMSTKYVVFKMHDNERVGAEDGENEENGI